MFPTDTTPRPIPCPRFLARAVATALAMTTAAAPAGAQGSWVEFVNETDARLVNVERVCSAGAANGAPCQNASDCPGGTCDSLGATDPQEKDYAWGDLDQDGDVDLVVARKQFCSTPGRRVNVLFMNENGVLVDRTLDYATAADDGGQGFRDPTNDRDVALVDVNGDGWLDIVTAPTYSEGAPKTISHPRIYINLGNAPGGNWQGFRYEEPRIPQFVPTPNFCTVAGGDLNDDGAADLYFGDYFNDLEDRLLLNDGTGYFTDETNPRTNAWLIDAAFTTHAAIADINGDGLNDIVKDAALGPYAIRIAYNDPDHIGFFDQMNDEIYTGGPYHFAVGNLNNDNRLDLIIVDDGNDSFRLNQGNGPDGMADFAGSALPNSSGFGSNTVIADLDGDGFDDAIVADVDVDLCGCNGRMKVFRNSATPPDVTFTENGEAPWTAHGVHDVAVFDLNGDGLNDMVIGTCSGTQVWMNTTVAVNVAYPDGIPELIVPDAPAEIPVNIETVNGDIVPGTARQHVSVDGGPFVESDLTHVAGDLYRVVLPPMPCPTLVRFYISLQATNGTTFLDPDGAPDSAYQTVSAFGLETLFEERFEKPTPGWTVSSIDLTAGAWERVDPNGTLTGGAQAQPEDDAGDGTDTMCYITQQSFGGPAFNNDVDGGPTLLISPPIDLAGSDALITYARWHFSSEGVPDVLKTEVTGNGLIWVEVDQTASTESSWQTHTFRVGAYVEPSAAVQVRFSVADQPNDSLTESGLDNFVVKEFACEDTVGPEIIHGLPGVSFADVAFGGYVDARRESTNGVDFDAGLDRITLRFTEPVVDLGGDVLTAAAFTLTETGGAAPPSISGLEILDERTVRLTFSRFITFQEWTTVTAAVQDFQGNPIVSFGDQGPGVTEPDRIDVAFLPADVNQSGGVNPLDLLRFKQLVNGIVTPETGTTADFIDMNRSGTVNPLDLLSFKQLINGVPPSTRSWSGAAMNHLQP